ncbi:RHS repeat-associated core domain-containing protein [Paenibacillus senegalimassiliensis]|uniref:RHS repeat-associated core domain-containing protein n=1 Tax=Paenibacillus senegalimassiliensis TaxID=1737426 RepID=UPI00073EC9B4|nr:RHS repeat-associated core domain-containing protein [Paenibacillus senegalimassiliensis]
MKKYICGILAFILLFITLVSPNSSPSVSADNSIAPNIGADRDTVTSTVYPEADVSQQPDVDINPDEYITISTVTERFQVEREWVLQELLKGYFLHEIYQGLLRQESGSSYEEFMQLHYPERRVDPLFAASITDDVYGGEHTVTEDVYITPPSITDSVYLMALDYDSIALERQDIKMSNAPYTVGADDDQISTLDGSLRIETTDLYLQGINGMDFALTRIYDSALSKDRMTVDTNRWRNETRETKEERRFNIGKGWIWDVPYLKTEEGVEYIYLPDLGTFVIDDGNELVGYPWDNLDFGEVSESRLEELDDNFDVDDADYVLFDYVAGINTYFTSNGDVVLITNQYGNHIKFSWGSSGLSGVFVYAGKGELVSYLWTSFSNQRIEIKAYDMATAETQIVTYRKITMEGENRDQEVLTEVIDPVGRSTKYGYYIQENLFNLIHGYEYYTGTNRMIYWGRNDWAILTSIEYPTKAMVQYGYAGSPERHIGEIAVEQQPAYKVRDLFYSTTQDTEYSSINIEMEGDIGKVYGQSDTFSATVDNGLTRTVYAYEKNFTGNRRPVVVYLAKTTVESLDKQMRQETNYTYDRAKYRSVPIQVQSRSYTDSRPSSTITTKKTYDDWGYITSETNPMGITTTYEYDYYVNYNVRKWSPTKIKVPVSASNSLTTSYIYNNATATLSQGKVQDNSSQILGQVDYQYDAFGSPIQIQIKGDTVDTMVNQVFAYGPSKVQQSVQVTPSNGGASTTILKQASYDSRGNVLSYTDGNTNSTTTKYDAIGRPIAQTYSDGSQISSVYHDATNTTVITEPNGMKITYEYDPFGRLIRETNARGSMNYQYDEFNRLLKTTDAEGYVTRYTYDAYGRILSENDGVSTTTYVYNDALRTKTVTDGEGNQVRETYDILDRLIKTEEIQPSGTLVLTSYVYDKYGPLLSSTDANGNTTIYTYDVLSRLVSVTDAEGKTTSYSYNMAGDMIKLTYADGEKLTKSYDEIGRMLKQTDPLGQTETYSYDHNGNVIQYIDRKGQTHTYQYSTRNLLTQDSTQDEIIAYTYDNMGNRLSMKDMTGTTSYAYAPTGELTRLSYPDDAVLTMDYDKRGVRLSQTFTSGNYKLTTGTTYQGAAALPQRLQVQNSTGSEIASLSYKYKLNNSLGQTTTGTGLDKVYNYTGFNLTGLGIRSNGSTIKQYMYGYDNNRNITSQNDSGASYTYAYDVLNRIKTSSEFNETYSYDKRDNRKSLTSDLAPKIPTAASYGYDMRNRLTTATVGGTSINYAYNGDGLMVSRMKNNLLTRYYYDDRQLLVAEGTVNAGTVAINYGYVFDAMGELVGRQVQNENKLQYYILNGHGDVVELRDASGNILNSYSYDIWGNPLVVQETQPNALRYSGEYWDEDTGLQYLRARWYDPATARFMGEDTYQGELTNPLSLNLYTYVLSNPLIYTDPSGQKVWLIHGTFSNNDTWTSDFVEYVEELFGESSGTLEWTGKNSKGARSAAAEDFVDTVYNWHSQNPNEPIRLVGHSHGGNVAIILSNLLENKGMKVETLITVATPVREYKLETEVGQHIHMYNNRDIVQEDMGGSWWWAGSTFTRKFKGADNVRAKDGETGTRIQSHSTMHSNVPIWKKYIEPILKLDDYSHSDGSF